MSDYEVGYGKPPREHRFKKGVCPNPAARGKRKTSTIGSVTRDLLNEIVEARMRGRTVRLSRMEMLLRGQVASAVKGDVKSAALLLDLLDKLARDVDADPIVIEISGGLPPEYQADPI